MNSKYTVLILAVLAAVAQGKNINVKDIPSLSQDMANGRIWDGLGVSATVNDYVDDTISMLVPFIEQHGLDPMTLPMMEQGFEVRPVLITYSAWMRLYDGYATGLVNIARSGDQHVNYFAKMLRIRIQLQFTDLEFVYKYLVTVMNIGPRGGIVGSLDRFRVVVDLLIDFNNDEVHLQEFSLRDIGRLRVRFTGNILIDWLISPVSNIFLIFIDTVIMNVVEANIQSGIQLGIDFINSSLKEVIRVLESYN